MLPAANREGRAICQGAIFASIDPDGVKGSAPGRLLFLASHQSMPGSAPLHVSVLAEEILEWLDLKPGQWVVDGTLGGGGHAQRMAEAVAPGGKVLALDRDPAAVAQAAERLTADAVEPVHANFRDLREVLDERQIGTVHAVLLDLGLSSDQLADDERGFSFQSDGPLDLRFDTSQGEPAWQLIARLSADRLADIIYQFGEERFSRRIARQIVETRKRTPLHSAAQLAELVRRCVPRSRGHRIDPATRTFQALRIAVNDELGALDNALAQIPDCLSVGGRVAIISFHSLEDRRVKRAFRDDPRFMALTKKPIQPNEAELRRNPRSRSAKLRVAQRTNESLP
jgi:16S rRNA (cytosine1402-N4)-methyltransferase